MIAILSALLACSQQAARTPDALVAAGPKEPFVEVVYFVPSDRKPLAKAPERITSLLTFVADVYRTSFEAHGLAARAPRFALENGRVRVRELRGKRKARDYNGHPQYDANGQWSEIVPEVEAACGAAGSHLYVVFAETYDDGPAEFEFPGGIALGARYGPEGGIGVFSAWILRAEFCAPSVKGCLEMLADSTPVHGRKALGAPGPDSPRFEFLEDGYGAVAHELGHALGLPHNLQREDVDIMGNGFRSLRENFLGARREKPPIGFARESARLLAASRFLAAKPDLGDHAEPRLELEVRPPTSGDRGLAVRGEAVDDRELVAVAYYLRDRVVGGAELAGKRAKLTLDLSEAPAGDDELLAIVADRGGNLAEIRVKLPKR